MRTKLTILSFVFCLAVSQACFAADISFGLFIKEAGHEGWSSVKNGQVAGTAGREWQTDAFYLSGLPFDVEYRLHVKELGWLPWVKGGATETGGGRRLEAIQFRFPKGLPDDVVLLCTAHLQNIGWTKPVLLSDNVVIGTTNQERRLEAIQICYGQGPRFKDKVHFQQLIGTASEVMDGLRTRRLTRAEASKQLLAEVRRAPAGEADPDQKCWDDLIDGGLAAAGMGATCFDPLTAYGCVLSTAAAMNDARKFIRDCSPAGTERDSGLDPGSGKHWREGIQDGDRHSVHDPNVIDFTDQPLIVTPRDPNDPNYGKNQ
jgi:hypothetical protein